MPLSYIIAQQAIWILSKISLLLPYYETSAQSSAATSWPSPNFLFGDTLKHDLFAYSSYIAWTNMATRASTIDYTIRVESRQCEYCQNLLLFRRCSIRFYTYLNFWDTIKYGYLMVMWCMGLHWPSMELMCASTEAESKPTTRNYLQRSSNTIVQQE